MEIQIHNFHSDLPGTEDEWLDLIKEILIKMDLNPKTLNIVLVDDETLQKMHLEYLNDPEKTDVITFDLSDDQDLEGEIYISTDRAMEQSREYQVSFAEEVLRLIIHGILHLKGFDDKTDEERAKMKIHEDALVQAFRTKVFKMPSNSRNS